MAKAHFVFTQLENSLRVHVSNLEELTIADIQKIEDFVAKRKGYFDFNSYSFVLQKRLEYDSFVKLVKESGLEVSFENRPLERKFLPRIGFGQYKGIYYNELPTSYLQWLENNYNGKEKSLIVDELKSRKL
jgi:hypothetical protein